MRDRKGVAISDVVIVISITAVLALILVPVLTRVRVAQEARCQSNMAQIGRAITMYVSDWGDTYPTNRLNPPMNTFIASTVPLAPSSYTTPEPSVTTYGVSWVEGLYAYIEPARRDSPWSVWRCPAAAELEYGGGNPAATYSFNANLIERHKADVRDGSKLMMCREMDRLVNSVLKPTKPTPLSSYAPNTPFLNNMDLGPSLMNQVRYKLHADGSNILFADGHVKYFPASYYPTTCQWNAATGQWFNYVTLSLNDPRRLSIAVTP